MLAWFHDRQDAVVAPASSHRHSQRGRSRIGCGPAELRGFASGAWTFAGASAYGSAHHRFMVSATSIRAAPRHKDDSAMSAVAKRAGSPRRR